MPFLAEMPISQSELASKLLYQPGVDHSISNAQEGELADLQKNGVLSLPEDFVLTDFDKVVLGEVLVGESSKAGETAELIKSRCSDLGYNQFDISSHTIHHYFKVLRGHQSSEPVSIPSDDKNAVRMCYFPDARDRYNVAALVAKAVELGDATIVPEYKVALQSCVAKMLLNGDSFEEIKANTYPSLQISCLIEMMLLDLLHTCDDDEIEALKYEMIKGTDDFPFNNANQKFVASVTDGQLFARPFQRSSNKVYCAVCELWLDKLNDSLKNSDHRFNPLNLPYVMEATDTFVNFGTGAANLDIANAYQHLGNVPAQLGSFIVHSSFGIDQPGFSPVLAIENAERSLADFY
jgi:hypothetical protein